MTTKTTGAVIEIDLTEVTGGLFNDGGCTPPFPKPGGPTGPLGPRDPFGPRDPLGPRDPFGPRLPL